MKIARSHLAASVLVLSSLICGCNGGGGGGGGVLDHNRYVPWPPAPTPYSTPVPTPTFPPYFPTPNPTPIGTATPIPTPTPMVDNPLSSGSGPDNITATSAILHGTIDDYPMSLEVPSRLGFEWAPLYNGNTLPTAWNKLDINPVDQIGPISALLTDLSPNTTYIYRVFLILNNQEWVSSTRIFTTPSSPSPTPTPTPVPTPTPAAFNPLHILDPTGVTQDSVMLNGYVDNYPGLNSPSAALCFQYAITVPNNQETNWRSIFINSRSVGPISTIIPGQLTPNTQYTVRLFLGLDQNIHWYSDVRHFTTLP